MPDRLEISASEHMHRVEALQARLEASGHAAMCVFGPVRISYLTGFHFSATERPIVLVVPAVGEPVMLIPQLETDHLRQQCPHLPQVRTYPEYPGGGSGRHPMLHLKDVLSDAGIGNQHVVADHDGYENRWGYRGPPLSDVIGAPVALCLELIDDLRVVKSDTEIALIKEACRWGDRAHRIMHDKIAVSVSEVAVSRAASLEATDEMLEALGDRYVPKARDGMPANAMFIRGTNTANPHGLHGQAGVQRGDVIVTGAYGTVGGYESELERTMIFGEPDARFAKYFDAMVAAQDMGFAAIRPGRTCADVERDVRTFIERDLGMSELLRHHTGHSFGLEGHEHPFLDLDDDSPILAGMILSVEPGLYVPGYAGFRHSDTVVVTATGCERLSLYPRGLEEMIIGAA